MFLKIYKKKYIKFAVSVVKSVPVDPGYLKFRHHPFGNWHFEIILSELAFLFFQNIGSL